MTLTEQEIKAILAEVKYKPGSRFYTQRWAYGVDLIAHYPLILCLEVRVPDAQTNKETVLTFRRPMLVEPEDAEGILELCRRTAWLWEQHEADEWLTYQGAKPFDPHRGEQTALMRRQLANLDALQAESMEYLTHLKDRPTPKLKDQHR